MQFGDALVAQIPALMISTAAGIIVSRAASEHSMGKELSNQLRLQPQAISLSAGILFVLGGVALMLGNYLHDAYNVDEGVVVGMVILFVGIGLVAFYGIAAKRIT